MTKSVLDDEIRVELLLSAPIAKVWRALSTPEGWTGWFSVGVEGAFQPGETLKLDFGMFGLAWARVVERVEQRSFAYQWHPGDGGEIASKPESELTTVRFELAEEGASTRLTMRETGFAGVPEDRRRSALEMNGEGWGAELGELVAFVEKDEAQAELKNTIIRERVYRAPIEAVWAAVATADGLKKWWCSEVRGTFALDEMLVFTFRESGSDFEGPAKITECVPGDKFSIRWHPGQCQGCKWDDFPEAETTRVRVSLTKEGEGTRLRVVEGGFENVPESRRREVFEMNSDGWLGCLDDLGRVLEGR